MDTNMIDTKKKTIEITYKREGEEARDNGEVFVIKSTYCSFHNILKL